jgi:DNA-binding transcriptional ArsR family regulator
MVDRDKELGRFLIIDVRRPPTKKLNEDINWVARSFGFLETRDSAQTAAKIFKTLLNLSREGNGLTSDEIAEKVGVTRGAIIHHLNKMMSSGLIILQSGQYKLRGRSLRRTVKEVRQDLIRVLEKIEEIAGCIDDELNLPYRIT